MNRIELDLLSGYCEEVDVGEAVCLLAISL